MYIDIQKYTRKLNIKKYLLSRPPSTLNKGVELGRGVQHSDLRNKSLFNPPSTNNEHIEVFKKMVIKDLEQLKFSRISESQHIQQGIKQLEANKDIIIRPADKGGAIVVLTKEYYHQELMGQLNDNNTYLKLSSNPTREYKRDLSSLIQKGINKNILSKKESRYLVPDTCRVPIIYTIPKIHKNAEAPPGRPIINGIQSINARLGEYVDKFLQPLVPNTKAYLRDTKHLLQILKSLTLDPNGRYLLATADVASLYTIIEHSDAIEASKWAMDSFSHLISKQKRFLLRSLAFGIQHNYFWYNDNYFRQLTGIGMGAKYAPSVANIFMAKWEEDAIFLNTPKELVLYKRFIDDCIFIWKGDELSLRSFFQRLNMNQKNIKLEHQISETKIQFLDLEIELTANIISTKTFFKPVERNSYIPVTSCHYEPWLINIPKGQFIRLRRNCSENIDYLKQAQWIGKRFEEKGYNKCFIEEKITEVNQTSREALIQDKIKVNDKTDDIPLIMDFSVQHRRMERIIKRHWSILKTDTTLANILPEKLRLIYRRAPTLRDIIAKNVPNPPKRITDLTFFQGKGFYPCKRCYACINTNQNGYKCQKFSSTNTGQEFEIKDFISCRTEGVVYALQCSCSLQYIGRTKRPMWKRIREHIQNIRKGYPKHSVSKHFDRYHNRDPRGLQFWAIQKYKAHWRGSHKVRELSKNESKWIFQMGTLEPHGLNIEFDLNCFISDF